ncbi:MAG: DNA-3-methyladenine glycosylase [Bacillota bacterium]
MVLRKRFFTRDAVTAARELVGKHLVREAEGNRIICQIVETEAYCGAEDKASHACGNRRTERTETMFGPAGRAYVYLIYGMYYCFNVVCGESEDPQAVLIRAVQPLRGLEIIEENRNIKSNKSEDLTNGPGKLCQALSIDDDFDGHNLVEKSELYIEDGDNEQELEVAAGKRINIDYAEEYRDKLWRFYIKGNSFISQG